MAPAVGFGPLERAAHHRIAEAARRLEGLHAAGEVLPDAEVLGLSGHFLVRAEQAAGDTTHRALAGLGGGLHV